MNLTDRPTLDRFLRRLHWRLVALRLIEWAGAGLLAGCVIATVLIPVLLWRVESAWALTGWSGVIGIGAGLVVSFRRLPRALDAAMEADRQLGLSDLLGTALSLRTRGDPSDAWAASVLAIAAARCERLSPSSVILRRFGARAWGGIGLAAALVLTLAALSTRPADSRGADATTAPPSAAQRQRAAPPPEDRPIVPAPWGAASRRPVVQTDGADDRHRQRTASPDEADQANTPNPEAQTRDGSHRPSPGTSGSGNGAAQSDARGFDATSRQTPRGIRPPESDVVARLPSGTAVSGSGRLSTGDPTVPTPDPGGDGTADDSTASRRETPPWASDTWPADISRARESLDAGRVPDAYRDLVRRYFDRP